MTRSIHTGVEQVKNKRVNLCLDIFLTIGLVAAMLPGVTGMPIHQGIGIVLGIGVAVHILLHRKWMAATSRSFARLPGPIRLKLVLNILLLLAFAFAIVSGLMNVGTLSSDASASSHWHMIHHAAALLTLFAVTLHLALHRRWVGLAAKRFTPHLLSGD
jgi:hypothetical protein